MKAALSVLARCVARPRLHHLRGLSVGPRNTAVRFSTSACFLFPLLPPHIASSCDRHCCSDGIRVARILLTCLFSTPSPSTPSLLSLGPVPSAVPSRAPPALTKILHRPPPPQPPPRPPAPHLAAATVPARSPTTLPLLCPSSRPLPLPGRARFSRRHPSSPLRTTTTAILNQLWRACPPLRRSAMGHRRSSRAALSWALAQRLCRRTGQHRAQLRGQVPQGAGSH